MGGVFQMPYLPSPMENFAQAIGPQIQGGIQEMFKVQERRQALKGLSPFLKQSGFSDDEVNQIVKSGLPAEHLVPLIKARASQKESEAISSQEYSNILDDLESQLETGDVGFLANLQKPFSAEKREALSKFQSQSTALLGLAQKVALKQGIRNQREFQTFLDRTVPNASDTIATAKGKIEALRSYIHGGEFKQSKPKSEKGSVLMRDPAGKLRKVSHAEAQQAQQAGYKLEQ